MRDWFLGAHKIQILLHQEAFLVVIVYEKLAFKRKHFNQRRTLLSINDVIHLSCTILTYSGLN